MLIHNKDDIEFVTEFPCFLGHPVYLYFSKYLGAWNNDNLGIISKFILPRTIQWWFYQLWSGWNTLGSAVLQWRINQGNPYFTLYTSNTFRNYLKYDSSYFLIMERLIQFTTVPLKALSDLECLRYPSSSLWKMVVFDWGFTVK